MNFDEAFPPLQNGLLVKRLNRFVVLAETAAGELRLHLPNTGRLRWLLPGTALLYQPRHGGRTAGRVTLAKDGNVWALLDSSLAEAALPQLAKRWGWRWLAPQPKIESRRLDGLIIDKAGVERYLEMKSATQVEAGRACFPDAPSARARAHLEVLARRRGVLVFAVLRGDASAFSPCAADPVFAAALCAARTGGLKVRAVRALIEPRGLIWDAELPIYC